jgi:peptidoglycan/LPS O-acetylase OafA/YrhL
VSDATRATVRAATTPFHLGYQRGFDGMRGAAVLMLLVYHALLVTSREPSLVSGAYLWVEMFFVQSGFLITSLLLEERESSGRINLPRFYWRRVLRLFPALMLTCAFVAVYMLVASPVDDTAYAWREVWTSLLYVTNWYSAFDPGVFPAFLSHTWSLAIEFQFYLVAPLIVLLALRMRLSMRALSVTFAALAVVTSGVMFGLSFGTSLNRLYMGTDTRAGALLIGMALAAAAHDGLFQRLHPRPVRITGIVGAVVFLLLVATVKGSNVALYRGLFLLCSVAVAAVLVAVVLQPGSFVPRILAVRPLSSVGRMAYGVYLWHWPVLFALSERYRLEPAVLLLLGTVITLTIAACSYHFVERPLLMRFAVRRPRPSTTVPAPDVAHPAGTGAPVAAGD